MGTAPSHQDQPLFFYHVNLEGRLRLDHPLRQVQAALALSFVLPAVQGHYGRSGHVSLDPRVFIKLMVQVGERLDFLWFVGFDLETTIPDHSVLSKARARWGAEVFERLFVRTVQQCVQAGLVDGRLLHVDSNLSTMCSLRRRKRKRPVWPDATAANAGSMSWKAILPTRPATMVPNAPAGAGWPANSSKAGSAVRCKTSASSSTIAGRGPNKPPPS